MDWERILQDEIDFEHRVSRSKVLSLFRRNPTTWELLLHLAQSEDGGQEGVYKTVDLLETRYLDVSAMLKFVRERRDDGLIRFGDQAKRSKRRLILNQDVRDELLSVLDKRFNGSEPPHGVMNGSGRKSLLTD